jgi:predicted transcriptional regulator
MVAENYSTARREMAHKIGLGQKGRAARSKVAETPASEGPKRARRTRAAKAQ